MKIFWMIILVIFFGGCQTTVQKEYVVRIATDEQKRIPESPLKSFDEKNATDNDLSFLLIDLKAYQKTLKDKIDELIKFYEKPIK